MTLEAAQNGAGLPDMTVSVRQVFGIDSNLEVPAYAQADEHVPDVDPDYLFNKDVTLFNYFFFSQIIDDRMLFLIQSKNSSLNIISI